MIDELMQRLQDPEATFTSAEVRELLEDKRQRQVEEAKRSAYTILQMIRSDNPLEVTHGTEQEAQAGV